MDTEHPSNAGSTATSTADAAANRRIVRRRPLKHGVDITVRKGTLGLGPNLAIKGVEISDDGVQVLVKSELKPGEEVEVGLTPVGRSKPTPFIADVRWCQPDEAGKGFQLGVQFRHRLTYAQFALFV